MEGRVFIGNNRCEDVNWLCSLSEAELDYLISLKKFALQNGEVVKHESLAKKLDLKMLRFLGFFIGQCVKGSSKDCEMTEAGPSEEVLNACNLLKSNQAGTVPDRISEELMQYVEIGKIKRTSERYKTGRDELQHTEQRRLI